ncbi:MAG: helix-turn-helix domain-containing protein [Oscillospiraceae bacterium]|nr:helix-turn-helix domain-containing protein [Oscillospiraceae bacterium]
MSSTDPRNFQFVKPDETFSGSFGRIDVERAKTWQTHSHNIWEICLILEGSGFFWVEGENYPFSPGVIFCFPPHVRHHAQPDKYFHDFCIGIWEHLVPGDKISIFHDDEFGSFRRLMEVYDHIFHTEPVNFSMTLGHLKHAMQSLLISWQPRVPSPEMIQLAEDLERNVSNPDFHVADAISRNPLNANYVRRQFRETFHMTPVSFMYQLRINQAKSILLTTAEPITEIAYRCGFTDAKYFTRLFHASTGFPPLTYRKRYQSIQSDT